MDMGRGDNSHYHENGYRFMLEALERIRRQPGRDLQVSSGELLAGIRSLAEERFGPMAALVFEKWGIRSGHDFGHIVFELVGGGVLMKKEGDLLEQFPGSSSYRTLFEEEYFLVR